MEIKNKKQQAAFTLIELLVVIAIIGLLASVVLVALNGARAKSRDAKRLADIRQMASAFEIYYNDRNSYPTQTTLTVNGVTNVGVPAGLTPTYIGQLPTAPLPADNPSGQNTCTLNNNNYIYTAGTTGTQPTYTLSFCLGGLTGVPGPGVHTLSESGIK